jgi:hypothetical protein
MFAGKIPAPDRVRDDTRMSEASSEESKSDMFVST